MPTYIRSFNLQDMCLVAVIRDIDFFVKNKNIPQKHIDFLFRVFPLGIRLRHKTLENSIDEEGVLWFLNPHLSKLDLLPELQTERIMQQLKVNGFGITALSLENSKATEDDLNSIVCSMPHLIYLNLSHTSCGDETLKCLQNCCPDLESLNIADCYKVTDCGMENLCQGKLLLKKLNVFYSLVTDFGIITILDGMPSLEYVEYHELLTLILHTSAANKQYNLTELIYNGPNIQDEIVWNDVLHLDVIQAFVKVCPRLKKLHFLYPISKEVLNACAHFQNLEELKIKLSHKRINNAYDVLTPILPISKNLKTLILSCVKISLVQLIECFKNLENLYLKKVSFAPFHKQDIKVTKTNLLSLVIKDIYMKSSAVKAISLLISLSKNVTKLYLKNCNVCFRIFDVILNSMKNLTVVNFYRTYVDMPSANSFFQIHSLEKVIIDQHTYTLEAFRENTSCTLSWRDAPDVEYRPKFNALDKNLNDETDVLSELCWSCGSLESSSSMSYHSNSGESDSNYSEFDSSSRSDLTRTFLHIVQASFSGSDMIDQNYSSDSSSSGTDESDMSAQNYSSDSSSSSTDESDNMSAQNYSSDSSSNSTDESDNMSAQNYSSDSDSNDIS